MKNRHYLKYMLAITALLFNGEAIYSQTHPIESYLKAAGDHATIYNGEIEFTYSLAQYENLPYFQSDEFTSGEIIFRGNRYPGLALHLDLYKDQLSALNPGSRHSIIINNEGIEQVKLHNATFIYFRPTPNTNLDKGFYELLHNGKELRLLARKKYYIAHISAEKIIKTGKHQTEYFTYKAKYYLEYNGVYYSVSNKKTFAGIFPEQRKLINRYVRKQKLNFRHDTDASLTALTNYCEELIAPKQTR